MDLDLLKKLIDLMNANDLLELEVVEEGTKIRLKKIYEGGARIIPMPMPAQSGTAAIQAAPAAGAPPPAGGSAITGSIKGKHIIKSPMVGTFYRSPNPESPAYVEVGDRVTPETTVCILEAMKVLNEIHAEIQGSILEILVQNGQTIEYGQPLFLIAP